MPGSTGAHLEAVCGFWPSAWNCGGQTAAGAGLEPGTSEAGLMPGAIDADLLLGQTRILRLQDQPGTGLQVLA